VTKILDSLVTDGYASRTAEERDGRRQIVRITAAGVRAANRAVPILAEPLRRAFSGLTRTEFKQLDALLRKSILSFDADPPLFGPSATSAASS
jgi:DNA-binding MarR family transcriptional regulator